MLEYSLANQVILSIYSYFLPQIWYSRALYKNVHLNVKKKSFNAEELVDFVLSTSNTLQFSYQLDFFLLINKTCTEMYELYMQQRLLSNRVEHFLTLLRANMIK